VETHTILIEITNTDLIKKIITNLKTIIIKMKTDKKLKIIKKKRKKRKMFPQENLLDLPEEYQRKKRRKFPNQ
jgi:hypothetical protein